MKSTESSAIFFAALLILGGGIGFVMALQLQSQLSGALRIVVGGIGFALPAFCGVQARRLIKGRNRGP